MLVHIVLVLSMLASPSEADAVAAFNAGDYDKALALYLERAEVPSVHRPDAYHGAHSSLLALFEKNRDPAHLCRAHELARDLLVRGPFSSDDERASWVEIEAKDAARVKETGAVCSSSEPVAEDRSPPAAPTAVPEGPAAAPVPLEVRSLRRPVARVAAGASLLGIGAGLVGGTAASLVGRARADASIAALDAEIAADRREPTDAEHDAVGAADRRYVRLTSAAAVLGIAAAVSLITGVALLAAPPRAASRARAHVRPDGLVYFF